MDKLTENKEDFIFKNGFRQGYYECIDMIKQKIEARKAMATSRHENPPSKRIKASKEKYKEIRQNRNKSK